MRLYQKRANNYNSSLEKTEMIQSKIANFHISQLSTSKKISKFTSGKAQTSFYFLGSPLMDV